MLFKTSRLAREISLRNIDRNQTVNTHHRTTHVSGRGTPLSPQHHSTSHHIKVSAGWSGWWVSQSSRIRRTEYHLCGSLQGAAARFSSKYSSRRRVVCLGVSFDGLRIFLLITFWGVDTFVALQVCPDTISGHDASPYSPHTHWATDRRMTTMPRKIVLNDKLYYFVRCFIAWHGL